MFTNTTYTAYDGTEHDAVFITWEQVQKLLGRPHNGTSEDDNALIRALKEAGAPAWIKNANGWIDEHGWYLVKREHRPLPVDA